MTHSRIDTGIAALDAIQQQTRQHLASHGCGAYTFNDGAGLMRLVRSYVVANQGNTVPRILELGCALGFSAACMASASPSALIDSIEMDETHVALARENMLKLGLSQRVTLHQGQFEALLPHLTQGYDAVFFDGFAPSINLLKHIQILLNPNGVLIFANLGLAYGAESQVLKNALSNANHWQALTTIENDSTQVLRRL